MSTFEHEMQKLQPGEALVETRFLPRCGQCGGDHPLARTPKAYALICPDCGAHSLLPVSRVVPAAITGGDVVIQFGKLLTVLGRFVASILRSIAERL